LKISSAYANQMKVYNITLWNCLPSLTKNQIEDT
jgi:hypothetical protein